MSKAPALAKVASTPVRAPQGPAVLGCPECACWFQPQPVRSASDGQTLYSIGTCRRRAPAMGNGGRGVWPLTLSTEGCADGVPT